MAAEAAAEADPAAVVVDSASRSRARVDILGFSIDAVPRSDIERGIAALLSDPTAGLLHIVTVNPEYVVSAQQNPMFRSALHEADLMLADGTGIVVAARLLCDRSIERVTGVDLVEALFEQSTEVVPRIFLLGNAASIAELQGRYPTRVVGRWGDGSAEPHDDGESIERIRERHATVVLVGYGAPAQVLWIERNREALCDAGVKLVIGVGGALDYVAGTVERAPRIVRRLGLEWSYRLVREPWRWRRQLALPVFVAMVARAWASSLFRGECRACRILSHDDATNRNSIP